MILDKRFRCVRANFYYGGGPYPVGDYELGEKFPFDEKLERLIELVELHMGKLSGGFRLIVDSVSADKYRVYLQGNGFDVTYEIAREDDAYYAQAEAADEKRLGITERRDDE